MRWWKPSGEGATQKPPVQSKEHMTSKCQRHKGLRSCLSLHAPGPGQPGSGQGPCLPLPQYTCDKGQNGLPKTQLHSSGTSGGFSESSAAFTGPRHLQKGDPPKAAPPPALPQLELIAAVQILHVRYSACPGQQGTGSRDNMCQQT